MSKWSLINMTLLVLVLKTHKRGCDGPAQVVSIPVSVCGHRWVERYSLQTWLSSLTILRTRIKAQRKGNIRNWADSPKGVFNHYSLIWIEFHQYVLWAPLLFLQVGLLSGLSEIWPPPPNPSHASPSRDRRNRRPCVLYHLKHNLHDNDIWLSPISIPFSPIKLELVVRQMARNVIKITFLSLPYI